MDTYSIPDRVDAVIIGTGLTNSIIAAACSRIGKSVLHLDENSYYGTDWASFTLQQLVEYIKEKYPSDKSHEEIPAELINKSRMFCIDLAPRFLFSNGPMVNLLVKSNVSRYHEFKNNIRILCMIGDDINIMPCRRNEVFTSPLLKSLAEKRRLMKFIEFCFKYCDDESGRPSEPDTCEDMPINEYLEERGLKSNLREFIINSIAMVRPDESVKTTCLKIKEFIIATDRYGKSPFLFPLYGCGEFPQSFCRLSAVFGGLYCLNTEVKNVSIANMHSQTGASTSGSNGFSIEFSKENHIVKSDLLVVEENTTVSQKLGNCIGKNAPLSRAILITKTSIVATEESESKPFKDEDMLSFLRIPPSSSNKNLAFLIELTASAMVCPRDTYLIYLWTEASSTSSEEDLRPIVERIFKSNMDNILWKFYYQQNSQVHSDQDVTHGDAESKPGLFITSQTACDDIDYSNSIKEAEAIFSKMCPDQEFLPRAPDPDEIISS